MKLRRAGGHDLEQPAWADNAGHLGDSPRFCNAPEVSFEPEAAVRGKARWPMKTTYSLKALPSMPHGKKRFWHCMSRPEIGSGTKKGERMPAQPNRRRCGRVLPQR